MRRFIIWATFASGVVAAYLMLRRGAPITDIAADTLTNPVGTMIHEVRAAG